MQKQTGEPVSVCLCLCLCLCLRLRLCLCLCLCMCLCLCLRTERHHGVEPLREGPHEPRLAELHRGLWT